MRAIWLVWRVVALPAIRECEYVKRYAEYENETEMYNFSDLLLLPVPERVGAAVRVPSSVGCDSWLTGLASV